MSRPPLVRVIFFISLNHTKILKKILEVVKYKSIQFFPGLCVIFYAGLKKDWNWISDHLTISSIIAIIIVSVDSRIVTCVLIFLLPIFLFCCWSLEVDPNSHSSRYSPDDIILRVGLGLELSHIWKPPKSINENSSKL